MGLINWARGFFGGRDRLAGEILEREFGAAAAASPLDAKNRRLWWDMYVNHPPWENCEVRPLGLPGAVGRELARQTLTEFRLSLSGGERAAFLNRQMLAAEKNFLRCLELGLCLGETLPRKRTAAGGCVRFYTNQVRRRGQSYRRRVPLRAGSGG